MINKDLNLEPYEPLSFEEVIFCILPWWEGNDCKPMEDLIIEASKERAEISDGFRRFILDVKSGKIKRPKGKRPSKYMLKLKIYHQVVFLLKDVWGDGLTDEEKKLTGKAFPSMIINQKDTNVKMRFQSDKKKPSASNKYKLQKEYGRIPFFKGEGQGKGLTLIPRTRYDKEDYLGAAEIVGKRYDLKPGTVLDYYYEIKKQYQQYDDDLNN